jgi:hypothetical protein
MLRFELVQRDFVFDGSSRDIYVQSTSMLDWDACLEALLLSRFQTTYQRDGVTAPLPGSAIAVFSLVGSVSQTLTVDVDGIDLNCHFFSSTEIEFDFDPRCVADQHALDRLVEFLMLLVSATGKPAIVTPETCRPSR